MCRWVLLATLIGLSVLLLRAVAPHALVVLRHIVLTTSEDLKYDVKFVMPA
jgi:hypothetical protein